MQRTETMTESSTCRDAKLALGQRDFASAISLLEAGLAQRADAQQHALLASALFQLAQYDKAAAQYQQALSLVPDQPSWTQMLAMAQANATAGVDVHVPELAYFDRQTLLAPPVIDARALPRPLPPQPRPGLLGRIRILIGDELGALITVVMHVVEQTDRKSVV